MDVWGVECVVSGSQYGLMLPAGIGILGLSQKAIAAMESSTYPTCYFDVQDMLAKLETGYTPYTPPVNLLRGMRVAIDMLLEDVWKMYGKDTIVLQKEQEEQFLTVGE
jgi:alanine-glyoxylate transaminase/serine-glyoxylate transaminase/serine-pyruvate transaminase